MSSSPEPGVVAGAKVGAPAPDAVHAGIADGPPYGVDAVGAAGAGVSVMGAAPMPVVIAAALPPSGVAAAAVVPGAVAGIADALAVASEKEDAVSDIPEEMSTLKSTSESDDTSMWNRIDAQFSTTLQPGRSQFGAQTHGE